MVALTVFSMAMGLDIRSVGDMGALPDSLPMFLLPNIPLNLETLMIILPYSVTLAAVGLPESLMTAVIVVDITDTPNQKNCECAGQGAANIVAVCFGGMAGCAMIGQSVINVKSGGRGRLSSLVAVMIMVSISTFSWQSLANLRRHPPMSSFVMLTVVAIVVATHN